MIRSLLSFFKTGTPLPCTDRDPKEISRQLTTRKWKIIIGTTLGYGIFYVARLSMSVVKKPILDEGILTTDELGQIGAALFFAYALGKFTNGFLADYANIKRFMSFGLLISALLNLALGFTSGFFTFVVLWGLNGWFQSMGAAPAISSISNWVPRKQMGTVYGWFSVSHNIGEGLSFVCTALLVGAMGWRWGFIGAGIAGVIGSVFLYWMLSDKPETYRLPPVNTYQGKEHQGKTIGKEQLAVLLNPLVWIIGLSSALMYVSRYAVNNWCILFLQEQKGYSLLDASGTMSIYAIVGIFGSISAGWISDMFFHSRRGPVTIFYGLLQTGGMCLVFLTPAHWFWADKLGLGLFGFATGGLLVLLGGLIAVDIAGKKAAGAAMGIIGIFSYIGAGCQEGISGALIKSTPTVVDGVETKIYDFTTVITFWIGASLVSIILASLFFYLSMRKKKQASDSSIAGD
ncbi:MFS transporter [Verrucomicrobiaceae bacterium N1E253]|uniref:MFS transporter n=1 Tax=Oceaniferula marina TaxID=2748318 RepID=A0A851GBF5_9BACT|nr:MFS transporter [Oceaniferula marina]NWK55078.1 MFS transporter [Oceaniferula marina]